MEVGRYAEAVCGSNTPFLELSKCEGEVDWLNENRDSVMGIFPAYLKEMAPTPGLQLETDLKVSKAFEIVNLHDPKHDIGVGILRE